MNRSHFGARGAFAALALALLFALDPAGLSSARAQEGEPSPPPPDSAASEERSLEPAPAPAPAAPASPGANPFVKGAPAFTGGDSTGLVLPPLAEVRAKSELELDAQVSRTLRGSAETRMLKARERTLQWKSQIETQKARLKSLDADLDQAKKEKREADKKELEAEKKYENKVRDYFTAMASAMEAEAEAHKAAYDYAQARITEVDLEQRLGGVWSTGGYDSRVSVESRDLERQVLLAVKDRATKMANYASREKTAADKRLEALKIWAEVQPAR